MAIWGRFMRPGAVALVMVAFLSAPAHAADPPSLEIINPAEAVPPQEYPSSSVKAGEEGAVTVKLATDAAGTLQECQVATSSGFKALDDQTCASIRLHGRFKTSGAPNAPDSRYTQTQTINWVSPPGTARGLFLGVTLTRSGPASRDRVRCEFSDAVVIFLPKGTDCVIPLPMQAITEGGISRQVNIVDYYLYLNQTAHLARYDFDIGAILAANRYGQALDYLTTASDEGLSLASVLMCGLHATPHNALREVYDPREAVRRCLLAHRQGLDVGMILIRQFVATHPDAATVEQTRFITSYLPSVPIYTTKAVLTVPGESLIGTKDYPKDELKHHIQGRTVVLVNINAHGRVDDCLIIQSSLSYALDNLVCSRFTASAIYQPATVLGEPKPMWTTQQVSWQIGKNDGSRGTIFGTLLGVLIGHAL